MDAEQLFTDLMLTVARQEEANMDHLDIHASDLETVEALAEVGRKIGLSRLRVCGPEVEMEWYPQAALQDVPQLTEEERKTLERKRFEELHYGASE